MTVAYRLVVIHGIVNSPDLKSWLGLACKHTVVLAKQDAPDFKKVRSDGSHWLRSTGTSSVKIHESGSGGSVRGISYITATSQILERLDEST